MTLRATLDKKFSHDNKKCYESMVSATRASYHLDTIRVNDDRKYEPYKCRWCYCYHVGRQKDRSMFSYVFEELK